MLALIIWLVLACSPSPLSQPVVFASPDSPRLRQVVAGLQKSWGPQPLEVAVAPEFGPQGQEALRRLRSRRPPLIIVLGTPALIRTAPAEKSLPVVFALVANPYFTGAAYDPRHPEIHQQNITGLASPPPLAAALEQGARLLGPCPWGMLYDPLDGEALELAAQFPREARRLGLTPLLEQSSDPEGDARGLARLLKRGARVIYLPPAKTASRYAPQLLAWGREGKVLVVSSHPEIPPQGAILYVALDYEKLGQETAALARRVLNGESPARIPITEKIPLKVKVDETLLTRLMGYPAPGRIR